VYFPAALSKIHKLYPDIMFQIYKHLIYIIYLKSVMKSYPLCVTRFIKKKICSFHERERERERVSSIALSLSDFGVSRAAPLFKNCYILKCDKAAYLLTRMNGVTRTGTSAKYRIAKAGKAIVDILAMTTLCGFFCFR